MSRLKLFIPLGIFVVLAIFLWRGLSMDPTYLPSPMVGQKLPEFSLPRLQGNTSEPVTKASVVGETFLLNVWATWCVSCKYEHPYLLELANRGVKIVGLNFKDNSPAAIQWLKELKNPYVLNIVDAKGSLGLDLGVYGAPETYVIDADGTIVYKHVGVVNEDVWTSQLAPLMN